MADDPKTKVSGADQNIDPPATWVQQKLQGVAPLLAPALAAVLVSALFCVYYFVYVREQRQYLTNRNFRFLAVLGDQIEGNILNHSSVLRYFVDQMDPLDSGQDHHRQKPKDPFGGNRDSEGHSREDADQELREDYMRYLAPDLQLVSKPRPASVEADGEPKLGLQRYNGRWDLTVAVSSKENAYSGTVSFEDLLRPFVGSLPFDDVLLATESGSIIYQKARTGPQFTTLAELLAANTPDKKLRDEKAEPIPAGQSKGLASSIQIKINRELQATPTHLVDIKIAEVSYRLFLQPVLIDVMSGTKKRANSSEAREWVLCGLVNSSKLEWQSLAISYRVVIWATVGFLVIALSAPLLKLLFLNKRERLTLRECAVAGVSLVLLTGLMTFAFLQGIYFHFGDPDSGTAKLVQISDDLATGISQELGAMLRQLNAFCKDPLLLGDEKQPGDLKQSTTTEVYRLKGGKVVQPRAYPNFAMVAWSDDDGDQIIKWSSSNWATPMINVAQLDLFKNLQKQNLADHPMFYLDSVHDSPFHLDSTLAPNKVDYFAAIGMRTSDCIPTKDLDNLKVPKDIREGFVHLVAKPFSLVDPVLPSGYGFALVDSSGKVLFHSDKTRNTRENFLEESDLNQQLYSSVFGHSNTPPMEIKYLGQDYMVRVAKIPGLQGTRWSLIVYRDLTNVRTLNLQTMTISSTLFLILLSCPTFVAVLIFFIRRPQYIAEYFWPCEGRLSTYVYQIAVGMIFSVLLLCLGLLGSVEEKLFSCAILTYSALLLSYVCFRLYPDGSNGNGRNGEPGTSPRILLPAMLTGLFAVMALWVVFADGSLWRAVLMLASLGCGIALLAKSREGVSQKLAKWFDRGTGMPVFRVFHILSAASLLTLVGVVTPVVLFHASFQVERSLQVKQTQMREAADLQRRQVLTGQNECEKGSSVAAGSRWNFTESDLSECDALLAQADKQPDNKDYKSWFRALISRVQHDFNRVAAETQAMISAGSTPDSTTPYYWVSEVVSGSAVLLITGLILWAVANKLFLYAIAAVHASKNLAAPQRETEKLMYATAGSSVTSTQEGPPQPSYSSSGSDSGQPDAGADPQVSDQIRKWVERECGAMAQLRQLQADVVAALAGEAVTEEIVILQVLETADAHYKQLWLDSLDDGQFVLAQLASDGMLNPVNIAAIRRLLKRRLIVQTPTFRIMNESFRRFVLTAATSEVRQNWRDESHATGWGKARGAFSTVMILIAIFLLATQNALWQSAAAYVTTAIGGFGTLLKLFHTVRGDKSATAGQPGATG